MFTKLIDYMYNLWGFKDSDVDSLIRPCLAIWIRKKTRIQIQKPEETRSFQSLPCDMYTKLNRFYVYLVGV